MALFSFYNVRKPRQFEHKPIYWDPRREALEERVRKVKREMGILPDKPEEYKPSIKGSFMEGTRHLRKSKSKGEDMQSRVYRNMRLLLVLAVMAILFWYLFLR
ncbi:MAG: hypothetical protein LBB90_07640 [Tannerella sp.]|jgi:hypothetical protein|nr:hypothetical protein [Tannerella sp.]